MRKSGRASNSVANLSLVYAVPDRGATEGYGRLCRNMDRVTITGESSETLLSHIQTGYHTDALTCPLPWPESSLTGGSANSLYTLRA